MTPDWIESARKHIGLKEFKGAKHNPVIVSWLVKLSAWWREDETPWCGVFVGAIMKDAGCDIPKAYYRAREWEKWGVGLHSPAVGCVVTFTRQGGGHVGFVVGKDKAGNLLVLGGNQGDEVNIRAFPQDRATSFRWPRDSHGIWQPMPTVKPLPVLAGVDLTTGEA